MIWSVAIGIALLLAQVVVFKNLVLFDVAFCFPYILLLLLFPIGTNRLALLLAGLVVGLFVDMFYDTAGINAAACVAIMFLRPFWLRYMLSGSSVDAGAKINSSTMGLGWFLSYATPLVFIHLLVLFFIEVAGMDMFWATINKVFWSSIFTVVAMVILQFLFSTPKARN